MTKEEIFLKFQDVLVNDFEIARDSITPGAKLYDDLELDSIDAIDIMVKMKEFLEGVIEPEQFKKAITVQDVVDMLLPLVKKS